VRERRLPQAGRSIKQNVIQSFAALTGGSDQNGKIFFHLVLTDQVS
jgi:hypothetical protein